ncbi:MAG: peptidylprolyl isomerase [Minicystis sp.]
MNDLRCRPSRSVLRTLSPALLFSVLFVAGCVGAAAEAARPTVEIPVQPAPAIATAALPAVDPGPIPATASDPSLGNADALVTLVIFGDLEDPFYHRAIDEARALAHSLGPEKVRVVYKHLPGPWHKHAREAELAAEAVFRAGGAQAFWSFHDAALTAPELRTERYEDWAVAAGVPVEAYRQALAEPGAPRKIDADATLAETLHIVAAPWVIVNGAECSARTRCTFVSGDGKSKLTLLVEAELAKATEALAAGVPRGGLYAHQSLENLANPAPLPAPPPTPRPAGDVDPAQPLFGAKHLLVMYQGSRRASPGITRTKDEARARAIEAMKKARRKGQDFAAVVKEYSDEPGAGARGGDLGKFPKGAMVPDFESALERMQVGAISDVVETPFGFHVILRTQ